MNESKPTHEDMENYTAKHGPKRLSRLLSALGKDKQFMDAWDSPVGKELMGELLVMTDGGLDQIIADTADERIKAEYRVCMALLTRFKDRISRYQKNLKESQGGK